VRAVLPIRKDSRTSPWVKPFELISIKVHERAVVVELWWVMGVEPIAIEMLFRRFTR
jgi:hypothetical protein